MTHKSNISIIIYIVFITFLNTGIIVPLYVCIYVCISFSPGIFAYLWLVEARSIFGTIKQRQSALIYF